jgi:hypothetical protein
MINPTSAYRKTPNMKTLASLAWFAGACALALAQDNPRKSTAGQADRETVAAAHDRWFAGILGRYDVLADVLAPDVTLRFPKCRRPIDR